MSSDRRRDGAAAGTHAARGDEIVILKTGETLPPVKSARGDFEDWIAAGLGSERERIAVCAVHRGDPLPEAAAISAVVVTGSPAMVTDRADWSEASARWLAEIVESDRLPVLGLCYGHQLLAHGLGGRVGVNPRGREMGTVDVRIEGDDPLLATGVEPAHMSHVESVLEPPTDARVVATTEQEAHAAIRFGPRQWGVQFHPEFDREIMQRYIEARREVLVTEGLDPDAMVAAVVETPVLGSLLARFRSLVA